MSDEAKVGVTPKDIDDILTRAAKEPGINDVMALLLLSREADEIQEIRRGLDVPQIVSQVTSTAGWVR
jgi:hypothetical protein